MSRRAYAEDSVIPTLYEIAKAAYPLKGYAETFRLRSDGVAAPHHKPKDTASMDDGELDAYERHVTNMSGTNVKLARAYTDTADCIDTIMEYNLAELADACRAVAATYGELYNLQGEELEQVRKEQGRRKAQREHEQRVKNEPWDYIMELEAKIAELKAEQAGK